MKIWPLKFRELKDGLIFTDDAGGFFLSDEEFLKRYALDAPEETDLAFLQRNGHTFETEDSLDYMAFMARWLRRIHVPGDLSYLILVPTLRCDLACDYCQVSRANEKARGFDWTPERLNQVLNWIGTLTTKSMKIEFQGGEPLLRLDLLIAVREFCRTKFDKCEFVVCTNLQNISDEAWEFLSAPDTFISTSYDGNDTVHTSQRTKSASRTLDFKKNVQKALATFGHNKLSALPTIDPLSPPDPSQLLKNFAGFGINSIFLRRVNFQGFARKRYNFEAADLAWQQYYREFVHKIIDHNEEFGTSFEEYYLSHLLKRILQGNHNGNVDLRSPSWLAKDFMVIDFDGRFFPTDEARMVTRTGQIDLSIGSLDAGLSNETVGVLNSASINQIDPDCKHCAYQQYCGTNVVDDLARYGRIDIPRHLTNHCKNHLFLFDFAFELLCSHDQQVQNSVAKWLHLGSFPHDLIARHK